jgi:Domain of unknown function (DUF4160)
MPRISSFYGIVIAMY